VLPAPEGYVVDFENPQRQAVPHAYYIAGVGRTLSLLMMGQRLHTKFVVMGKIQMDDSMTQIHPPHTCYIRWRRQRNHPLHISSRLLLTFQFFWFWPG
jgi:hypothetical protein